MENKELKNTTKINQNHKKCKTAKNNNKNKTKTQINNTKIGEKEKLIAYIKALLDIYKSLPKIISVIDTIVEKRACSLIQPSSIYGDSFVETQNQINKVLDMTERKDKLLNLYIIIETMLNSLDKNDKKFTILKFIKKSKTDELAKEFNLTERSIFRKTHTVIERILDFMIKQKWTTAFLESQIGNEPWIKELFYEKLNNQKL